MSFASAQYLIFLLACLLLYGLAPGKWRWLVLLSASYAFYALWHWQVLWVLALITLSSYWAARQIARAESRKGKNGWLAAGLAVVLVLLGTFKYFGYLAQITARLFFKGSAPVSLVDVIAPLGISFFSLQVIAYLMDVSRGQIEPETNLGQYALFVAFFPQLVAGPITRAQKLLPQVKSLPPVLPGELAAGFNRILWGALQKFVIADRLAQLTDPIFAAPQDYSAALLLANLYLYAVQIYADFAGYSNIAIGVAKLFGAELAENFNQPYLAKDVADFWNRWHISLSRWLRDYIFYPVMRFMRRRWKDGARVWFMLIPPVVTMLVSGVWHGAGPKFVLWGFLHGGMLALAALTASWRQRVAERLGKAARWFERVQIIVTLNFVVFAWVFFRLPGMQASMNYLQLTFLGNTGVLELDQAQNWVVLVVLAIFLLMETFRYHGITLQNLNRAPLPLRWGVYYLFIFLILFLGNFTGSQPFIYEQF
ncbi:MAG: MBOAT family O-acyltransferase [Anaerolineales bacterium]|jgi:D-alanyl-lipoteichoic acid acyltransferase DltB (MBOAT superfamily)